jgi:hypothetical protein
MLKDLFSQNEINKIAVKNTNALVNFSKIFNTFSKKKKHIFLAAMRNAGFTIKEAKFFEFKISFNLWSSCQNNLDRNQGGRPFIKKNVRNNINLFMLENSTEASNRFLKRQSKNARYLNGSIQSLYSQFKRISNDYVSLTSFTKIIRPLYKKPHRFNKVFMFLIQFYLNKIFY